MSLSDFFGKMRAHVPFKPRPARAHAWTRKPEPQYCSNCAVVMVADRDGHLHCPHGCYTTKPHAITADVQAQRAAADVPTITLSERPLRFDGGPAYKAVDYRLQFEKDTPHPFADAWLNSAVRAESAPVVPVELSPEHTAEHQTPGLHWLKYKRYNARQLNGELPRQNKPDA